MPFYRRRLTYDEVAPIIQKLRLWLRMNCVCVKEYEDGVEAFIVSAEDYTHCREQFNNQLFVAQNGGYCEFVPWFTKDGIGLLTFNEKADGPAQTVSPTHIKLPKLSHLITLTPNDFFKLLLLVATSKVGQPGASMLLNPAAANIDQFEQSPLYPYFTKLRTNYRMNPEYADKKWTPREDVKLVANLEPTPSNQLTAMQYLTARQNNDLLYFPVEAVVDLELPWQQITDDYCLPNS